MKVAIACDHGGIELKDYLKSTFTEYDWLDLGTNTHDSVDYPDYGYKLAEAVSNGEATRGVAICGTGIGISIACNKYKAIRAAVCTNASMARLAQEHNDADILCLGARIVGEELAKDIFTTFMNSKHEGGRHQRRVDKLTQKGQS